MNTTLKRAFWLLFLFVPFANYAEIQVLSPRVESLPALDGHGTNAAWGQTKPVPIFDQAAKETIILSTVYTAERIYFLAQFPDKVENSMHKPWM